MHAFLATPIHSPHRSLSLLQRSVYRLALAPLYHVNLVHLACNLLTWLSLAPWLERQAGSLTLVLALVLLAAASQIFAVALATALTALSLGSSVSPWRHCSVGFSGVLFALVVVDGAHRNLERRSIFGALSLPAPLVPWVLVGLWQLLVPQSSLLAHLGGVVAGVGYVRGGARRVLPSSTLLCVLEAGGPAPSLEDGAPLLAPLRPGQGALARWRASSEAAISGLVRALAARPSYVPAAEAPCAGREGAPGPREEGEELLGMRFFSPAHLRAAPRALAQAFARGPRESLRRLLGGLWQQFPANLDPRGPLTPPAGVEGEGVELGASIDRRPSRTRMSQGNRDGGV